MTLPLFNAIEQERRSKITWKSSIPPSLEGIEEIYLDVETTGLKWWEKDRPIGFALKTKDGREWYLPIAHKGGGNLDEQVVKRWFQREVRNKKIINVNTRFDIHHIYQWGIDLEDQNCEVSDVAHWAALLDDSMKRGFSLDALSEKYLGVKESKIKEVNGEKIDYERMAEYHAGEIDAYARRDVELVAKLRDVMWPELEKQDLQRVRQLEDDAIYVTCEMERNGALIDKRKLEKWCELSESEIVEKLYLIHEISGFKLSTPDSRKDLIRIWKELKLPKTELTDEGQPSFKEEALKLIDHPLVNLIRETKHIAHVRSKYLKPYRDSITQDGHLQFQLHQLRSDKGGTISGRYSATKIQIVPAVEEQLERFGGKYLIRELFIPSNGKLFFSSDAKQIEYRLFAHYAANPKVLEEYEKNPDLSFHKLVWEWVKPFKPDIKYKEVKNLNFAQIYGAGKEKTSLMLEMERDESDLFVRFYHRRIPEIKKLIKKASATAQYRGYVKTILGRRTRFENKKFTHKALNSIIQGSGSDIMKRKMVEVHRENRKRKLGVTLRLTVHDQLCGDVPNKEIASEVQKILNVQSFNLSVPILWDMSTAENWAQCEIKSKS